MAYIPNYKLQHIQPEFFDDLVELRVTLIGNRAAEYDNELQTKLSMFQSLYI